MIKKIFKKANASWIRVGICGALFMVIITFTFINMKNIVNGIVINAEIVPATTESKIVHVKGVVKNSKSISLNGREIFIDEKGNFNEALALPDGYSIITLAAIDKGGERKENTIEVISKLSGAQVAIVGQNIITN